jgi:hypothetical protein
VSSQWHLGAGIDELRFSLDGKQLLAWGYVWGPSCKLILLSIADGKRTDLYIDSGALESAAFSPVEPFVAAGTNKSWDLLASRLLFVVSPVAIRHSLFAAILARQKPRPPIFPVPRPRWLCSAFEKASPRNFLTFFVVFFAC